MDNQAISAVQAMDGNNQQQIERNDTGNDLSAILNTVDLSDQPESSPVTRRIEVAKCRTCARFVTHAESDCPKDPKFDYKAQDNYIGDDEFRAAKGRRLEAVSTYQAQLIDDPMGMKVYYEQVLSNEHPGFGIPLSGSFAATHAVLSTTELLEEILVYLRPPDLMRCMAVCHKFNSVIADAPAFGKLLWWDQRTSQDGPVDINYHLLEPGTQDSERLEWLRPKLSRSIEGFPRLRYHIPQLSHEWNEEYGLTHELELLVRPEFLDAEKYGSFCNMHLSDCTEPLQVKITQDASPTVFKGPKSFWWGSITVWMKPASLGLILDIAIALYVEACSLENMLLTYDEDPEWVHSVGSVELVPTSLTQEEQDLLIQDKPVVVTERRNWMTPDNFGYDFVEAESEIDWENDAQEIARGAAELEEFRPMLAELAVPRHLCKCCLRHVVHPEDSCYYNEELGRSCKALMLAAQDDESGDGEAKNENSSEGEEHVKVNTAEACNGRASDGESESDEASDEESVDGEPRSLWISDRNLNWALEQVQLHDDKGMDDPLQLREYMSHALPASHPAYSLDPTSQLSADDTVFAGRNEKVLEHILSHLNTFDLLRCKRVSSIFKDTMSKSRYLQETLWRAPHAAQSQEGRPTDPVLNYNILSYENACKSTKRCTLNVRNAHLWPKIKYFVPEPIAPHRIDAYGEKPRLEIHLTEDMTPQTLRGPSFLAMYLSNITADTWVSVTHKLKSADGSIIRRDWQTLPFERIDVKLRPATLGTMFTIASKLYQEALQLHGPAVEDDWTRDSNARPFKPSTLTAREEELVVGRIGLFERFNGGSRWFRGIGSAFATPMGGYCTKHAEEEDGDAYELSEEAVEEIIMDEW